MHPKNTNKSNQYINSKADESNRNICIDKNKKQNPNKKDIVLILNIKIFFGFFWCCNSNFEKCLIRSKVLCVSFQRQSLAIDAGRKMMNRKDAKVAQPN